MKREVLVAFADEKVKRIFEELRHGVFEDKNLFEFLNRAINDLKNNPTCGIRVPSKLIPKIYIQKYGANNLWKYNLPNAWRLLYTIKGDEVRIVSIILEWMDHKNYERRFGYG